MNNGDRAICPLGPRLQRYWDRLTERERSMRFDEEGLFSLALESIALGIAERTPGNLVADVFCGVGGSAIGFARVGKDVIAVEKDREKLRMAEYNAGVFGVRERIEFIYGDCMNILPTLKPDTVFLDPPWGGTDYNRKKSFSLSDFEPDGKGLLAMAFSLTDSVVFRLPKNFNFDELESLGREYKLEKNFFDGRLLHYCVYFK
ncbi:MAG: RsmD family RNA methyltransferase [Deltaproteobacteria bacterium]